MRRSSANTRRQTQVCNSTQSSGMYALLCAFPVAYVQFPLLTAVSLGPEAYRCEVRDSLSFISESH